MKHIMSVSLDAETVAKIQDILRSKAFRNKSHVVETAIQKLWEAER